MFIYSVKFDVKLNKCDIFYVTDSCAMISFIFELLRPNVSCFLAITLIMKHGRWGDIVGL